MAKITVSEKQVQKLVLTTVKEKIYTLELSENEATAIVHLASKVGGVIENTYRKYTDTIAKELYKSGIECPTSDINWFTGTTTARNL